jgi:translation initiation factor 1
VIHQDCSQVNAAAIATQDGGASHLQQGRTNTMANKGGWQEFGRPESLQRGIPQQAETTRAQQRVRVQRTKAGKGGKLVTAITGLEIAEAEAKALLKALKATAGTGGTLKDGVIELQGDQLAIALTTLEKEGFRPKQAGG